MWTKGVASLEMMLIQKHETSYVMKGGWLTTTWIIWWNEERP